MVSVCVGPPALSMWLPLGGGPLREDEGPAKSLNTEGETRGMGLRGLLVAAGRFLRFRPTSTDGEREGDSEAFLGRDRAGIGDGGLSGDVANGEGERGAW